MMASEAKKIEEIVSRFCDGLNVTMEETELLVRCGIWEQDRSGAVRFIRDGGKAPLHID